MSDSRLEIASLNTAMTTGTDFLEQLAREREASSLPPRLHELSERFVRVAVRLLFAQFAREEHHPSLQLALLSELLDEALQVPGPHADRRAEIRDDLLESLPELREALLLDAQAIYDSDPAATGVDEVILAYPGFYATAVHRLAHILYLSGVPVFPRLLSEFAHRLTGIDIHPGAQIGPSFAIDHGTGIVIGETAQLGARVRLYQGVTLGAASVSKRLLGTKRHPTIGDDVVIYANATILGGDTVIGDGSLIGGNVWLTRSVPAQSIVSPTARVERARAQTDDDLLEFNI
jgi:serine O-acetyltransferase